MWEANGIAPGSAAHVAHTDNSVEATQRDPHTTFMANALSR
jgi:hypothetical protein